MLVESDNTPHCISIDSEDILVEGGVDSNDVSHLVVDLQLERRHRRVEVDPVEILHDKDLTVTLSSVTRLRSLGRLADLDDDDVAKKYRI